MTQLKQTTHIAAFVLPGRTTLLLSLAALTWYVATTNVTHAQCCGWQNTSNTIYTTPANPNVGIGTDTPGARLDVLGVDANPLAIFRSTSGQMRLFGRSDGINYFESGNAGFSASQLLHFTGAGSQTGQFAFKGRVGIGTTAPAALFHLVNDNAGSPFFVEQYSGSNDTPGVTAITARAARGTFASPTALKSGDYLGRMQFSGFDGSAFTTRRASTSSIAAQDWTTSAQGTHLLFETTPIGTMTFTERMRITSEGNVGIGTATPAAKFELYKTYSEADGTMLFVNDMRNVGGSSSMVDLVDARGYSGTNSGATLKLLAWQNGDDSGPLVNFATTNGVEVSRFYIERQTGNVGIGTTNPQHKLSVSVKGTIGAQEITVLDTTNWPDYVFKPGYRVKPLREIDAYVKQHGHLPGIPSEKEVREKGVSIGEMQAKLLAKVEELTLLMIQAEERNNQLEKQCQELRRENAAIREQVTRVETGSTSATVRR